MTRMAINVNSVEDWENRQLADFKKYTDHWGFSSKTLKQYLVEPPGTDKWKKMREETLNVWFNYQRRLVKPCKRNLHHNSSLSCPTEVVPGWLNLQQEVVDGVDLTPRLSRKIEDADYNDLFLNDWGFHHFHLGTTFDEKHPRQIERTGYVLIAVVDSTDFYPISFVRHGYWANQDILEKAIGAFPEHFERFRLNLNGITGFDASLLDANTALMRGAGVNGFRKIGNGVYMPTGFGVTTAGTSIAATMMLDQCRKQLLYEAQRQVDSHGKEQT